jgi:hypothetical protein
MRMRLAGYARRWTPVSGETTSKKLLIVGTIVAAHVAVLGVWMLAPDLVSEVWGEGGGGTGEVEEVIRYYDITTDETSGEIRLAPAVEDSLRLANPAAGLD